MEHGDVGTGFGVRMGEASTRYYFDAIGAIELLSPEAELSLARDVRHGLALQQQIVDGTLEADSVVAARIADGQIAEQILVERNLRLVPAIAAKHACRRVGLDDLIQEGNMYLTTIVRSFDPDRGNRFSTYAVPALDRRLKRVAKNPKLMREAEHDSVEYAAEQGTQRVIRSLGDAAATAAMERYDETSLVGKVLNDLYPQDETLPKKRQQKNAERRTILYLAWVEGMGATEIADMLGKERAAIEVFVRRKTREARELLAPDTAEN